MATPQEFQACVDRLNAGTSKAGAKIDALVAKLTTGGLSDTEETAVLAQLSAVADALEAMGQDVANPVPIPVPA